MTKSDKKPEAGQRKGPGKGALFSWGMKGLGPREQRSLIVLLLALLLTFIIVPKGGLVPDYYAPGDIASRDIKAPRELNVPDQALTEKKRLEAEEGVRPLYDFDPDTGQEIVGRLNQTLDLLQDGRAAGTSPKALRGEVESSLGVGITDQEMSGLAAVAGSEKARRALRQAILETLDHKSVGNLKLFQADLEKGIVIRNLVTQNESPVKELQDVVGPGEAQDRLKAQLKKGLPLSSRDRQALLSVVQKLLRPNLTLNKNETEERKRKAREAVNPVFYQIKKGEMIVREGERVTAEQIQKLRELREMGSDSRTLHVAVGLLLSILLMIYLGHRFGKENIRKYRPDNRDFFFLAVIFLGLFLLIKVAIFVSNALESAFPYIESTSYYYAFPFAVGAMLVRIVLNSEVALIFSTLSALLLGILFGNSLFIAIYALVGSLTGAHWVARCTQRTILYRAGLWVSLVNVVLIVGLHLLSGRSFDLHLVHKLGFGGASGFFCAVIVTGTIPLVEFLFKYTTDIKLLELANMNSPVLRELMIQAPGTYHHSIIVGNLVEAAAEAINANPLMARVAAYYHDIGKIRKPLYFVENLGSQENRHDKLAPSMSALILMAHVKDGVELAREHKLGEELIDVIRQHHGTALIKFFYDKAKSKADPEVQQVDERDYRYPGPKPQTREAALIMLADAVEAASRTLADPTPARIQGMVQKIINNIFIDGQLDECELTLKDLHSIAKSFNRILAGIFHHRVDYPEPAYKEREKDAAKRKNSEDIHREPAKEAKDKEADVKNGSTEDLKRLGMS